MRYIKSTPKTTLRQGLKEAAAGTSASKWATRQGRVKPVSPAVLGICNDAMLEASQKGHLIVMHRRTRG